LNKQADPHQFLLFGSKTTGLRQSFALTRFCHTRLTAKTPGIYLAGLAVASESAWKQGRGVFVNAVTEDADGQNVASCHANDLLSSI